MKRMLHTLLSHDFTLCDCLDMWRFPIMHFSNGVSADDMRNPARVECAAIDQVMKVTSHVWISEPSSWCCVFIDFWSWVIFTSCRGSKESSKWTNVFNNNCVYIEETDQLTDCKTFYLLLTFCIAVAVTAKCYEQKHCPCFTWWCSVLPLPLCGAPLKFMKACNNNHVPRLIWCKTKDQHPFAGLFHSKIPDFRFYYSIMWDTRNPVLNFRPWKA